MMDDLTIEKIWQERYQHIFPQISKTEQIGLVATGFNTNIDAVVKIKGSKISQLATLFNLKHQDITTCPPVLNTPKAVICGIIKCFTGGIAEEWLTTDTNVDKWIEDNIGTDKLQMGGQAGIIANVLALTKAKKIAVNTASHPEMLSEQFIKVQNLLAADENGKMVPAYTINRPNDIPPIHRIIEFDKGDTVCLNGETFVCPKSNRFIATYDPLNAEMAINRTFAEYLKQNAYDYLIFAGYNLLSGEKGLQNALNSVEILKQIKQANPNGIMHLEIASTQDKNIRRLTVEKVTEIIDSIGLNERETLDVCEVLLPEVYNNLKDSKLDCINLFDALLKIKKQTKVSRIQLHIFGLYICLQDKNYKYTPLQTLYGMSGACIAAASKAELGYLQKTEDLTYALREGNGKICFTEIKDLAKHLKLENLLTDGIAEYEGYDLIITPTMLVEKPKTLVGMGDTISSLSLILAR